MCKLMSGIITRHKTLYDLDSDNHEELIKKAGLKDTFNNPDFVRVEIIPIDENIFNHDPKNWQLKVDQGFRPKWFSEKFAESEMRKALQELFSRFIINKEVAEITAGRWFMKNGIVQKVSGSSVIDQMRGSSVVNKMWESSVVNEMRGSSVVRQMRGSSVVRQMWGSSVVNEMWESSVAINRQKKEPLIYVADKSTKLEVFNNPKTK